MLTKMIKITYSFSLLRHSEEVFWSLASSFGLEQLAASFCNCKGQALLPAAADICSLGHPLVQCMRRGRRTGEGQAPNERDRAVLTGFCGSPSYRATFFLWDPSLCSRLSYPDYAPTSHWMLPEGKTHCHIHPSFNPSFKYSAQHRDPQ